MVINYIDNGLDPIPSDLTLGGCLLVQYWDKQDYKLHVSTGSQSVTFIKTKAGVPEHIRSILEVYRRI